MNVNTATTSRDDLKMALEALRTGKPLDPTVEKRILEHSQAIRKRLPPSDVAVELTRDARDP
jgi:hypothetical protein